VNPEQLLANFKKLTGALSTTQLVSIAAAFVGVVVIVGASAYWINKPDMVLLADGLDSESASAVVTKLKAAKVAYELGSDGRSIRVPAERVNELRLQVASDGFPSAGRIGFELFDKTSFGTTDAQEQVNYQRALQGELERTISTLSEVASARVHLTMSKDSLFSDQSQPAKASVMLRLKTNRPLSDATVRGIAGLVSNSVESLRPESVAILDTYGRLLSRADENGQAPSGLQLDRQLQIERDLSTRVVALLEPVVGPGKVRVNVSARLKADAEEETEERWDPTTVVRSRQTNVEADQRAGISGGAGVVGARANLPEGASAALPAPSREPVMNGTSRNSETTNYEVSKLTRHRLSPQGQLARLSVAVIVDDAHVGAAPAAPGVPPAKGTPRTPDEIQRIQKIVAAAVGLDQQRGDQLTVENMAFDAPVDDTPVATSGWPAWKETIGDATREYGMTAFRTLAVLTLALAALFGVLRPMSRRAMTLQRELAAASSDRLRTVQEMEAMPAGASPVAMPTDAAHRLPGLSRQVARLAADEPEQLARIVRGWLAEEER
jgi:flagellar M-ring protein FliF